MASDSDTFCEDTTRHNCVSVTTSMTWPLTATHSVRTQHGTTVCRSQLPWHGFWQRHVLWGHNTAQLFVSHKASDSDMFCKGHNTAQLPWHGFLQLHDMTQDSTQKAQDTWRDTRGPNMTQHGTAEHYTAKQDMALINTTWQKIRDYLLGQKAETRMTASVLKQDSNI